MPLLGFYENGYSITQGSLTAALAQPVSVVPTLSKQVDLYVFRDKTTTTVDRGKRADQLRITGYDLTTHLYTGFPYLFPVYFGWYPPTMNTIDAMVDAGERVYVNNLAPVDGLDAGYNGYYFISNFRYNRKAGVVKPVTYELTLEVES